MWVSSNGWNWKSVGKTKTLLIQSDSAFKLYSIRFSGIKLMTFVLIISLSFSLYIFHFVQIFIIKYYCIIIIYITVCCLIIVITNIITNICYFMLNYFILFYYNKILELYGLISLNTNKYQIFSVQYKM